MVGKHSFIHAPISWNLTPEECFLARGFPLIRYFTLIGWLLFFLVWNFSNHHNRTGASSPKTQVIVCESIFLIYSNFTKSSQYLQKFSVVFSNIFLPEVNVYLDIKCKKIEIPKSVNLLLILFWNISLRKTVNFERKLKRYSGTCLQILLKL